MRHFVLILLLFLAGMPGVAGAASPEAKPAGESRDRLHADVTRLLAQLDDSRFEVRCRAADAIDALAAKPELQQGLAAEFQRVLLRSDISFEVRRQVERWSRQLPSPPDEPAPQRLAEGTRPLDAAVGRRFLRGASGATRRLDWMLGNPKLICPIMIRLKHRLADKSLDRPTRQRIEAVWQRARDAWLSSDVAGSELPPVSDDQIDGWLDDLTRPASPGVPNGAGQRATRPSASCSICWPATNMCRD